MNSDISLTTDQIIEARFCITALVCEAYDNAREHGFHKADTDLMDAVPAALEDAQWRTSTLAKLALITSEVGEAVSAIQHNNYEEFAEELADIVIRVMDLCGAECLDLGAIMLNKMKANRKRPYLHDKEC